MSTQKWRLYPETSTTELITTKNKGSNDDCNHDLRCHYFPRNQLLPRETSSRLGWNWKHWILKTRCSSAWLLLLASMARKSALILMATSGPITGADTIPGIYFLLGGATTAAILCNHQVKRHKTRRKAHITRYLSAQWSFWRNTRDTCVPRVSSKREAKVRLHGQDSDRIL